MPGPSFLAKIAQPGVAASRPVPRFGRAELAFLPAAMEIVETPPSPTARATAAAFGLILVFTVGWSYLGKVDVITTAPGRVLASGLTRVMQPLETSVVSAIEVREGERVTAGQTLILLDPTENAAERDRAVHDLMIARLDEARLHALLDGDPAGLRPPVGADTAAVLTARTLMQAQAARQDAKLGDLDHQVAEKHAELNEDLAEINRLDATLPMLQAHLRIRESSLQFGAGNQLDYFDALRAVVDQQQQRLVDQRKLVEMTETIASLLHQRAGTVSEYRSGMLDDLEKAQGVAADKQQDLVKAAQLAQYQTMRAPIAGTVQQLQVHTPGGVVTPAQPLLSIVPDGEPLEVDAMIPNREVGFIQPGQPVDVKVESLEFTRYGLLHGKVVSVSRDAVVQDPLHQGPMTAGGAASPSSPHGPGSETTDTPPDGDPDYLARIRVSETGLQTEQGFVPLQPGMTVTAEIKTGRRRVIDYLLSPLRQYRHDVFRER